MKARYAHLAFLSLNLIACAPGARYDMSSGHYDYQSGKELQTFRENDDTVTYIQDEYRTAGAPSAKLASVGRVLVSRTDTYERLGSIPGANISTNIRGVATIENNASALGKAGIDLDKILKISGGASMAKEKNFKVVIHEVSSLLELESQMNLALAENPTFAVTIKDQYVRVITAMAVIYDHQSLDKIEANIDALLSWKDQNFFETTGGGKKSERVQIADGVIVAYQFSKICWSTNGTVAGFVRDRLGNNTCPAGTMDAHPDYFKQKS